MFFVFRNRFTRNKSSHECGNIQQEEIKSFSSQVYDNILFIQNSLVHTEDFIIHDLAEKGALLYIESLVDLEKISDL